MRSLKLLVLTGSVLFGCAVSTGALAAECVRLAAIGDGLTKDIAVIMAENGLKNIIAGRGMKGEGPVTTTCGTGWLLPQCTSQQTACK